MFIIFKSRSCLLFALVFLLNSLKAQDLSLEGYTIFAINTTDSSNQNISVANNLKFALKFSSNPTTGYDWYFTNITYETTKNLVEFLNLDQYGGGQYQAASTGLLGSGGYTYFLLESAANKTGEVDLEFIYKRIWETNGQQDKKGVNIKVGS